MYEMVMEGEKHVLQAKDNLVSILVHINNMGYQYRVVCCHEGIYYKYIYICSLQLCRLQVFKGFRL